MENYSKEMIFGQDACHLGGHYGEDPPTPDLDDMFSNIALGQEDFDDHMPSAVRKYHRYMRAEYQQRIKVTDRGTPTCVRCLWKKQTELTLSQSSPSPGGEIAGQGFDDSSTATYHFQPLPDPKKSFRLLELVPAPHPEDPLRATLTTYPSRASVEYAALSYTWAGVATDGELDLVDGKMAITGNLALALRALRKRDSVLRVWVDAVCINQSDNAEKSAQVAQMGDIYREADVVLAWLGPETEQTEGAIKCVEEVAALADTEKYADDVRKLSFAAMSLDVLPMEKSDAVRIKEMWQTHAVDDIYARAWFSRLWIVQEFMLAKRMTFHIGRNELDYGSFRKATKLFYTADCQFVQRIRGDQDSESFSEKSPLVRVYTMFGSRDQFQRFSEGPQMVVFQDYTTQSFGVVKDFASWGCKDERDRVYAVLSLIPALSDLSIVPDYDAEPEEVYIEFARKHIQREGMQVLLFAGLDRRRGTIADPNKPLLPFGIPDPNAIEDWTFLPSWVPEPRPAKAKISRQWRPLAFNAGSLGEPAAVLHSKCQHIIAVRGAVFDKIEQPFPVEIAREENKRGRMDFLECMKYVGLVYRFTREHYEERDGYPTGEPFDVAFKAAITANETLSKLQGIKAQRGADWLDRVWGVVIECYETSSDVPRKRAIEDGLIVVDDIPIFFSVLCFLLEDHVFAITESGLLAFVPNCYEAKDVIAVVNGLGSPVLMRPTVFSGQYNLIGPCYLHGVMEGELGQGEAEIEHAFLELV
ncbi:hypothetical protein OQA88_11201 [Cercophora sp. LCS_1]